MSLNLAPHLGPRLMIAYVLENLQMLESVPFVLMRH